MKELVFETIKKALKKLDVKLPEEKIKSSIEIPKDFSKGDFSFPCFKYFNRYEFIFISTLMKSF